MIEHRKYRFIVDVDVEVNGRTENATDEMFISGFDEHGVVPVFFDDESLDVQAFCNGWKTTVERIG